MTILFICSGNSKDFGIAPFVLSQAKSLQEESVEVLFYKVIGKGIRGYLKNVKKLRAFLREHKVDVIHAHYSFNGLLALLAMAKPPIVVSFMGSDTYGDYDSKGGLKVASYINIIISKFIQPFIKAAIVKSPNLAKYIYLKRKTFIVPNGVNTNHFLPINKETAKEKLGLAKEINYALFLGDKGNERKNFGLSANAVSKVSKSYNISLLTPYPVSQEILPYYMSAADVVLLSSYNEGSPNVIKEAMACNRPIVSTNVGDVEWLFGHEPGHFIAGFDVADYASKLKLALDFSNKNGNTNGRERLKKLGLDSQTIAQRIISIYKKVLNEV
jgi:glycosyltransferase involved in cell wall biosynthesis